MDKTKLGAGIKKTSRDVAVSEDSIESGEIWISPRHWKSMSDDNKAVVVDLYHRHNSYSDKFPFKNMTIPVDSYSVGITFSVGEDSVRDQALMVMIKELKIAHLHGSYEEIRKGKEKLMPKSQI